MDEKNNLQELRKELNQLKKAQARVKRKFTFLLSVIATLVLITATLAWFTLSNFASMENINLKISTAPGLYLDIENKGTDVTNWQKVLTNQMVNDALAKKDADPLADQLLDPVTTNDGISFTGNPASGSPARVANNDTYLEFDVWFIATTDMWVHLSGQTVKINDVEYTTQCTTTEGSPKDDVVKALRVSFEDNGATPAPTWEPNKGAAATSLTTFDVSENFSDDDRIFHLNKLEAKKITFRIWAEGEDPECTDPIQDANATIEMLFGGTDANNVSFT